MRVCVSVLIVCVMEWGRADNVWTLKSFATRDMGADPTEFDRAVSARVCECV